jgi:hypothetical protein
MKLFGSLFSILCLYLACPAPAKADTPRLTANSITSAVFGDTESPAAVSHTLAALPFDEFEFEVPEFYSVFKL